MEIEEVLQPEYTLCNAPGGSKKRVLEFLSHFLADRIEGFDADDLFQQFLARERIGSTAIGEGVAIPHCRIQGCDRIMGALLKLEAAVDFDALDDEPVDLVFALIVPDEQNDEHLQTLSAIARLMQEDNTRKQLRDTSTSEALFQLATGKTQKA